jgi:uncharacterized protein
MAVQHYHLNYSPNWQTSALSFFWITILLTSRSLIQVKIVVEAMYLARNNVELLKQQALAGERKARGRLAWLYLKGIGVALDHNTAIYWFEEAAEQGDVLSQYNLGSMYAGGIGVQKDLKTAFRWCSRAAEQGYAEAQFRLGWMYRKGFGVTHDDGEAKRWYSKAAEQGLADGQYHLGMAYYFGRGAPRDYKEAARWYHQAACKGQVDASCALAMMHLLGLGVSSNKVSAYLLLSFAVRSGVEGLRFRIYRHVLKVFIPRAQRIDLDMRANSQVLRSALEEPSIKPHGK